MAARLSIGELVDRGDLDELLRRVDDYCDDGEWQALLDLRDRCRAAFERGRQLWPAASHAEYRLALQAPGRWAAAVVTPGAGRFALGPLSEVAAATHTWDELAAHLPATPEAGLVAQERVLRGEDLRADTRVDRAMVELPLVLLDAEPAYPEARYRPYAAEFDDVVAPATWETVDVGVDGDRPAAVVADGDAERALVELAGAWTTQSNGQAVAVAVEGDAPGAVGALGVSGTVRVAEIDLATALAILASTGASGGAHGRRRGMAQGRFGAWWAAAALAGALDDWPDVLDDAAEELRWYRWERLELSAGWSLRIAAERPEDGRAFAVEATDRRS
ncbi:MAG TPA: hypothetical protein VF045_09100 [Acidimicrobiales bacterium]